MSIALERALILYFSLTKQFYKLCLVASRTQKDSVLPSTSNVELRKTIREEFNEKRNDMIDFVFTTVPDDGIRELFMQFVQSEIPFEIIPQPSDMKAIVKTATKEKLKRLNIQKNMLTEKEIETDLILNNGEVSTIIRTETSLIFLKEAVEEARIVTKANLTPSYISYIWTISQQEDYQIRHSMLKFANESLNLSLDTHELLFKALTYKSGHGACVGVVPANVNAPKKSNVKVIIIFSGFDTVTSGEMVLTKGNESGDDNIELDMHTALWRSVEAYLEETVYHNEEVNRRTGKECIEYIIGGYGLGGVFCQLTAIKLQSSPCHSIVATTLDTLPVFDSRLLTIPSVDAQKAIILNFTNINDAKIRQAKQAGLTCIGREVPFRGQESANKIAHDYAWMNPPPINGTVTGAVAAAEGGGKGPNNNRNSSVYTPSKEQSFEFSQHRFTDPDKLSYQDEEVYCWFCMF